MGITLSQIAQNTATVTFQYGIQNEDGTPGSQPVTVVYYPGHITEKTIGILNSFSSLDANSFEASFQGFNDMLVHLIKSWDVYEDEAQTIMFPIDASRLAELPLSFRMQVITVIMEDIRPETIAPQTKN